MAIIGRKKNKEKNVATEVKDLAISVQSATSAANNGKTVIIRPRITEKASMKSEVENVYVFEITNNSSAKEVMRAVHEIYGVRPVKVNTVNTPRKKVFVRGKFGVKSGVRKAYVFLKKGDKIEII